MADIMDLLQGLTGCSVTQRIKQIKQPRGGYLNPKTMEITRMGEGMDALNPEENIHATLVGLTVDYLTRFMSGSSAEDAFSISRMGAECIGEGKTAQKLITEIKGLDDASVANAVKLTGYDVCYRAGIAGYQPIDKINPDHATAENIRIMVERSVHFFEQYGPKILDGFTFEGGYTDVVRTGDGDFTTPDTLWDFKVSKMPPKKEHTLQLLMYWRMGLHSIHPEFQKIQYLGIYNPRMNLVYRIAAEKIPNDVICEVERDVIGYRQR